MGNQSVREQWIYFLVKYRILKLPTSKVGMHIENSIV